jgi:hypothetical protein
MSEPRAGDPRAESPATKRFLVWVENRFEVEAENEEEARVQAIHDMAFGYASLAEVDVTDVQLIGEA